MNLTPGGNAPVAAQELRVRVISGGPVDASAFRLFADGKVRGDSDMVFYGQPRNEDGSISFSAEGTNSVFTVDLSRLKPDVQKVAFTVTCDGSHTVSSLNHLSIQIESGNTSLISGQVELSGRQEAALILGEVYRRNGDWKFRFIAQGFNGGLKPLAEVMATSMMMRRVLSVKLPVRWVSTRLNLASDKQRIKVRYGFHSHRFSG